MADLCDPDRGTGRPKTRVPLKIEETLAGAAIAVLALLTFANVVVRYATDFSFAFKTKSRRAHSYRAWSSRFSIQSDLKNLKFAKAIDQAPKPPSYCRISQPVPIV